MIKISIATSPNLLFAIRHGPWLKPDRWRVQVGWAGFDRPLFRECWRWGLLCVSWGPRKVPR